MDSRRYKPYALALTGMLWLLLLSSVNAASATISGAELFRNNCSVCHGSDGQGGVGVPLNLPSFLLNSSDRYLYKTIQNGRPGRIMPSFAHLSSEEIEAIIGHIRSWQTGETVTIKQQPVSGDVKRGKALFAQHCASCHGENGKGGEGTGVTFSRPRNLPILPPALNNAGFLASASDSMIKQVITVGREGTPMPSMAKAGLSEQQIDDIVAYIRHWEKTATAPDTDHASIPAIIEYESPNNLEDTIAAVKMAATGRNFRYIREQTLDDGLVPEGQENSKQQIYYFCNFEFLNDALSVDPRIGMFLPFRASIVEVDGVVKVMTVNPDYLCDAFNNQELKQGCQFMADNYTAILEEGTF